MRSCLLLSAVLCGGLACAQDPDRRVAALLGDDAAAERALRELLLAPAGDLPVAALRAVPPDAPRADVVTALLVARRAHPEVADLAPLPAGVALAAVPVAASAALAAAVADARFDVDLRCRALFVLADRGAVATATWLQALAADDERLQAAAASLLRHELRLVPADLLAALQAEERARRALLRVLASAPRPSLRSFADVCAADPACSPDERCLALAARGTPLSRDEAVLVFRALAEEGGDGWRYALDRVPAAVADDLVGKAHELLAAGVPVPRLLPFFDRLSKAGELQLLGLAAVLPPDATEAICQHLAARGTEGYWDRVRAALDAEIPLEPHWLLRAGRLLDRPARIARVAAVLADQAASEDLQVRAFEALLEARVTVPAMVEFARAGGADRLRRLLAGEVASLPESLFEEALGDVPAVQIAAAEALQRRPWSPALERTMLGICAVGRARGPAAALRQAVAVAVVERGSEAALRDLWQSVQADPQFARVLVDLLGKHRSPAAHALLLQELAASPAGAADDADRAELLDQIRLALVEFGDRRQFEALLATAPSRPAVFVRRCRHAVPELNAAQALRLLDAVPAVADGDVRLELVLWAAGGPAAAIAEPLRRLWRASDDQELREAALQALLAGATRGELLAELRAALRKPGGNAKPGDDDEGLETLAWAVLGSMPESPAGDDLALLAEIALLLPLGRPDQELRRAVRSPEGRAGFAMAAGVAHALRTAEPAAAGAAFRAVAETCAADPRVPFLARQRLVHLWIALVAVPDLQQAIGAATAPLLFKVPDLHAFGEGPASLWLAREADAAGDPDRASVLWAAAARRLLRSNENRLSVRIFLGERDPAAGSDPCAALAARRHLSRAAAAALRGDAVAARAALADAEEFLGCDAAAARDVESICRRLPR